MLAGLVRLVHLSQDWCTYRRICNRGRRWRGPYRVARWRPGEVRKVWNHVSGPNASRDGSGWVLFQCGGACQQAAVCNPRRVARIIVNVQQLQCGKSRKASLHVDDQERLSFGTLSSSIFLLGLAGHSRDLTCLEFSHASQHVVKAKTRRYRECAERPFLAMVVE